MKRIVKYKNVLYPLDSLGKREIEIMRVEIEKQHPDFFKKETPKETKKEVHNKKELD